MGFQRDELGTPPIEVLMGGVAVGVSFTPFYQYEYYWLNGIFRSSGTTSYVRYLEFYDGFIYAQRQFRIR